jgi:REP element-mobilizing transposase RayT
MGRHAEIFELPCKGRGGRRPGAGRPKKKNAGVSHLKRPTLPARYPVHVTLKLRSEVPNLRTEKRFLAAKKAFRYGCDKFGMRLIEFSVQSNHIHLIVEANDRRALSRGMQGLLIRLAKQINRACERRGHVFADRYHEHILKTPAEVRNAVHYVKFNGTKHSKVPREYIDGFSSAWPGAIQWEDGSYIVVAPATWLLQHAGGPSG